MKRGAPLANENHEIRFGSERIRCELVRSGSTRLRLIVTPALHVTIKAPRNCSTVDALTWARQRAGWIVRQQDYFREFLPRPEGKRYVSGESFRYLGRQYRLKVEEGRPQRALLRRGQLMVTTREPGDPARTKALVDNWYRKVSKDVFDRRLDACMQTAQRVGIPRPALTRRRMRRRWGSCRVGRSILLNTELVTAPVHCIDYVIMHELCHSKVPSHGPRFYRLLGQLMPDWERRKERLERFWV